MNESERVPDWAFHWNPLKPVFRGRFGRLIPIRRRVNNFGDLLGPVVIAEMMKRRGTPLTPPENGRRLFSVGSVAHFAADDDVVWGTGVNGKIKESQYGFSRLDVRAVRGPRTAEWLRRRGIAVPDVYGDPALLLPGLDPRIAQWSANKNTDLIVVPNLNDLKTISPSPNVLDPRSPVSVCLERIARSRVVVASSLHGIIIGESSGATVIPYSTPHEPLFKYDDYYEGTGRSRPEFAGNLSEAMTYARTIGDKVDDPLAKWSPKPLLASFPWDLWERRR